MKTPCSREYTLTVNAQSSPVVCASCAYPEFFADLDSDTIIPGTPSEDPAWDGVFDKATVWGEQNWPMYYFENKSLFGIVCTPDKSVPGWQGESNFVQLYWTGTYWEMFLGTSGAVFWTGMGPTSIDSPIGLYTAPEGEGYLPPLHAYISAYGDGFCVGSVMTRGEIAPNSWPVTQQRIADYAAFLTDLTAKPTCSDGSAFPVWTGTFPTMRYTAGILFWDAEALPDPDYSYKNIKGMKGVNLSIMVNPSTVETPYFQITISCEVGGAVWVGKKYVGKTANGVYVRTGGSSPAPACLTVETY